MVHHQFRLPFLYLTMLRTSPIVLRTTFRACIPSSSSRLTSASLQDSYRVVPLLSAKSSSAQHQHRPCARHYSSTSTRMSQSSLTSKIAVVGAGDVGSTVAYSLILNPVASEILLIDPKKEVRDAQIQDLSDATYHGNTTTQYGAAHPRPQKSHQANHTPTESAPQNTKKPAKQTSSSSQPARPKRKANPAPISSVKI